MSLSELQRKHAYNVGKLLMYIYEKLEISCAIGEAERTKLQAELYAAKGKGIRNSQHLMRLAIDLLFFDKENNYRTDTDFYKQAGDYWESLDPLCRWGGRYGDGNHFETMNNAWRKNG